MAFPIYMVFSRINILAPVVNIFLRLRASCFSLTRVRLSEIEYVLQEKDYNLFKINKTSSRWLVVERDEHSANNFISF